MIDRALLRRRSGIVIIASSLTAATAALSAPALAAVPAGEWHRQEPVPTSYTFRDVDMISAAQGWTAASPNVGDNGLVFTTIDGGVTWTRQGGAFRQLNTVSFSDAQHGIAFEQRAALHHRRRRHLEVRHWRGRDHLRRRDGHCVDGVRHRR